MVTEKDEYFMGEALKESGKAFQAEEVPVGAVIVIRNKIIARGYNQVEKLKDPTAHAEMIALTSAFNYLGGKYLMDASIYVTVEPCLMCAGALYWSKIGRVIWGADDEKNGFRKNVHEHWLFHPKTETVKGVLQDECAWLIKKFFEKRR